MAAAASTPHCHRPWQLLVPAKACASRRTGWPAVAAGVGAGGAPNAWTGRLLPPPAARRAVRTKAGAAEARPSSPPDAVTYSASISTDTPLHEPPGVSFDEYLQDSARVFRAMFPDESRSQRVGDGEWRVQMLPLQFLLLTVRPVVVMQLRHRHRAGGLDLRVTEWELRGLDVSYAPSSFDLDVSGSLYADRSRSRGCRMRGHLEIAITCVLPPPLRLVPETVLRGVAESVLSRLAEKMRRDVDVGLVADFRRFHREKAAASRATPTLDGTASSRDQASERQSR
ncbi:hypothetical protein BDA96_02G406500 [Sorghum bicolor]|uniref:Uncharacterized protein n=2 Tax=Sorghum bicolor TaxID=4558 RepID=A0A921RUJ6_SORBI|nr:uncharacterized protein LOC8063520 [Sorghum bicolor]EER97601.1 hypothetical protein SORBI_3002G387000 [Sorghum bicolor]KAG0545961.1 hypothetical protein BDA96_02G406500 [Sorghum bicolor]|eukprot:XP_002461080.1 uncharacterized protein LOC8063520 [Sorghum bicolor]